MFIQLLPWEETTDVQTDVQTHFKDFHILCFFLIDHLQLGIYIHH